MKISTVLFLVIVARSQVRSEECGVYLAPSTIPGAGLGMFAGKDFKAGERVTWGDVIIPLVEISWNNGNEYFFWLWDEYTWGHSIHDSMEFETELHSDLAAASPGIGAAVNCILGLVNIEDTSSKCDSGGLHRNTDPGVGAFTPYHDRGSVATRNITAGDELFIDYGSKYFISRERIYGQIPLHDTYKEADPIMYRFHRLQSLILKYYSEALQNDLWKIATGLGTRISNALPSNVEDLSEDLLRKGTAYVYEKRSHRGVEWLEENGQCMDNIRNGQSTIPQAGRGAFATRFIPAGGLVAPAPLIHIPNKTVLAVYDVLPSVNEYIGRNVSAPIHQQLMMNYCFGHPDSDVLLSPYGALVSLINHSPTQANTRIVWSSEMRHPEWLHSSPMSMDEVHHSGLMFNFVALRDIEEGEEILIDYGREWQAAWDDHVANWKPPPGADKYEPAFDRNENFDSILPTPTEGGVGVDVKLWVRGHYAGLTGVDIHNEFVRAEILDRYTMPNNEIRYRAYVLREMERGAMTMVEYKVILWSLPRDAFVFDDLPYTRDHVMPWSFRHYIGIPDDMFPESWKRTHPNAD